MAASSEDADKVGDVLMNLAYLLLDDKGDEQGAREPAEQAVRAYASVGSEKEGPARRLPEDLDVGHG